MQQVGTQPVHQAGGRRVLFRNEGIGRRRLQTVVLPTRITYGVELESFYPSDVNVSTLQSALSSSAGWRVKNDNSIVCNPRVPSCYKAELVSPVLRGTEGLATIFEVLGAVRRHSPSVNKTTGLHVHVGVNGGWQLPQLKRLAYNFVQLESAYDLLMPKSRRKNSNQYCRSNLEALKAAASTNSKTQALAAINAADSVQRLQQLLCPQDSRYMKMNLMALNRHGTVEFRHAGGSVNPAKVAGYVLLWTMLAEASLSNRALASMPKNGYAFENLLQFYAPHPVLTHWLPRRKLELNPRSANNSRRSGGNQSHSTGCGCADCRR